MAPLPLSGILPNETSPLSEQQGLHHSSSSSSHGSIISVTTQTTKRMMEARRKDENRPMIDTDDDDGDDNTQNHHNHATGTSSSPPNTTTNNNNNLVLLVCVAAATAATLGYDVGIMAAAIQPLTLQLSLSDWQKEIAMGSLNFVAAFGAFGGGHVADQWGRKSAIQWCCWLFVVGTVLMSISQGYPSLLIGRIITGLGVGIAFVAAPTYITEVAPASSRGRLNAVFDVSINGGILAGYVTGFLVQWAVPDNWRLMLACGLILPVLVLALLSRLPPSPRWLMIQNRPSEAQEVLRLHLGYTDEECRRILQDMQDELDQERTHIISHGPATITSHGPATSASSSSSLLSRWCRPPTGKHLSKGQRYAIWLGFWQQITGTEAVLYYSADYLLRAGLESPLMRLGGNVFVGICKLVPEGIAMQYIDSAGRRPLLLGSSVALFLSTLSLSVAFAMNASPMVVVILLCCIMASFSSGLGPFTFLSASENLAMSERAMGVTYCSAANRITSGTVAMTAVTLTNLLGDAGLFGLYAGAGFASLFFYWSVPETAGVSLEELAARSRSTSFPTTPTTSPSVTSPSSSSRSSWTELEMYDKQPMNVSNGELA